jgi:hypothetical protein
MLGLTRPLSFYYLVPLHHVHPAPPFLPGYCRIKSGCYHLTVIRIQLIIEDNRQLILFRGCPQSISAHFTQLPNMCSVEMGASTGMQTSTWEQTHPDVQKIMA